ncbi:hypothetical protein BC939DRAFT_452352 [Gamsiella multidivaricata]|uniref:uncharacterized protein n=1 Tax=Gamsiella multidivaricata TaxID=101098 RepID=UPI00221F4EE7|nr:uncharacterized protein BC939DRAFT_452352 [Gamsiella multidivaricata]KAI7822961.1 hypothetical protein BC939DRAFT_452352 [Gamsiella multidivaricata]
MPIKIPTLPIEVSTARVEVPVTAAASASQTVSTPEPSIIREFEVDSQEEQEEIDSFHDMMAAIIFDDDGIDIVPDAEASAETSDLGMQDLPEEENEDEAEEMVEVMLEEEKEESPESRPRHEMKRITKALRKEIRVRRRSKEKKALEHTHAHQDGYVSHDDTQGRDTISVYSFDSDHSL